MVGAPKQYDPLKVAEDLERYTDLSDDPMIEEFCLIKKNPSRDTLYRLEKDCKVLSDTIKALHAKQQARTVKLAEAGAIPTAWAIFKMKQKQYGWTDKQEIESTNVNLNAELSEEEAEKILKKYGLSE